MTSGKAALLTASLVGVVALGIVTAPTIRHSWSAMNAPEKIGTLEPGTTADIAILDLEQGSFEYNDGARQMRTLKQRFVATATIKGGIFLKGAPAPAGRGVAPAAGTGSATPAAGRGAAR